MKKSSTLYFIKNVVVNEWNMQEIPPNIIQIIDICRHEHRLYRTNGYEYISGKLSGKEKNTFYRKSIF